MDKKLTMVGMALLAMVGMAEAKEINMLFMGSSFTFRHDLPELVKQVFEEGQTDLTVIETNPKGKGEGKDPDGGDAKVVFDDATKTLLQKAAYSAVIEFNSGCNPEA